MSITYQFNDIELRKQHTNYIVYVYPLNKIANLHDLIKI